MTSRIIFSIFLFFINSLIHAKVLMPIDDALKMYFSKCEIFEEIIYLKDEEINKVLKETEIKLDSKILNRRIAICEKQFSYIYFDTGIIRTKPQTLMVIVKNNELVAVELLAYYEPENYIPGKMWYETFKKNKLETIKDIPHVAGATLTHRATSLMVKKILALHSVVKPYEKK